MSVGTVKFANGKASIREVLICDEGCSRRATGAVVTKGEGVDGTDAGEEILFMDHQNKLRY